MANFLWGNTLRLEDHPMGCKCGGCGGTDDTINVPYAPTRQSLSPRQTEVLRFIIAYKKNHDGNSPTYDEISLGVGINSKGSTYSIVKVIVQKGWLSFDKRRRIILCPSGEYKPDKAVQAF